jgi:ABC-type bacteriocin/lantibiotic exporter with double-glycine peptidase domain
MQTLKMQFIRSNICLVSQTEYFFNATIRENLQINETFGESQLDEACRATGALNFIANLPDGYDTVIHENGINFSIGQKKMITLSRAFLVEPQILLLDEPTAGLDGMAEKEIMETIRKYSLNKLVIVVTHDKKYLEKGTLVEIPMKKAITQLSDESNAPVFLKEYSSKTRGATG